MTRKRRLSAFPRQTKLGVAATTTTTTTTTTRNVLVLFAIFLCVACSFRVNNEQMIVVLARGSPIPAETCLKDYNDDDGDGRCMADPTGTTSSSSSSSKTNDEEEDECKLYLAESTIPNAGLGIFTSIDLSKETTVGYPEVVIPTMVDVGDLLLYSYVWDSQSGGTLDEGLENHLTSLIPGLGAAINGHPALFNVYLQHAHYDNAGLHRNTDPGAGAFSPYFGWSNLALRNVKAGTELFADYGEHWFLDREYKLGLIPLRDSYWGTDGVLSSHRTLLMEHREDEDLTREMKNDLWDLIKTFPIESRELNALPDSWTYVDNLLSDAKENLRDQEKEDQDETDHPKDVEDDDDDDDDEYANRDGIALKEAERKSSRSVHWLETHGYCMDNIRPGKSTIPQAGRGAFASRFIPKGTVITLAPLIQIPNNRKALGVSHVYTETDFDNEGGEGEVGTDDNESNEESINQKQSSNTTREDMVINYSFGHRSSTIILIPYGAGASLINHNSESPNVKVRWPQRSSVSHDTTWLNRTIESLEHEDRVGLSFEYVATRDIFKDEEIFIDYGKEWEEAWTAYVSSWTPPSTLEPPYEHPQDVGDDDDDDSTICTVEEQKLHPYPPNVDFTCICSYGRPENSLPWNERRYLEPLGDETKWVPCTILSRDVNDDDGTMVYTAQVEDPNFRPSWSDSEEDEDEETDHGIIIVQGMPRESISIYPLQFTSDLHLPNAFRHEMMIPDDIFPSAWINKP